MGTWYTSSGGYLTGTVAGQWPGFDDDNDNYVAFWRTAYADTIRLKAQQTQSILQGSVTPETIRGRQLVLDSWRNVSLTQRSRGQRYGAYTTGGDKNYSELETERRQVETEFWEYAELFDPRDEVALMRAIRPDGSYAEAVAAAFARKKDQVIIAAFDATANLYPSGTQNVDAGMTVDHEFDGAGGTNGLTLKKLIEANRLLKTNPVVAGIGGLVNDGDWHAAAHPNQIAQLLNINQITSADYNTVRALVSGELNTYMGFTWHTTPLIADEAANAWETGNTGKYVFFYHRSAMVFGMSQDMTIRFDEIADRGYALQAFHSFGIAALRMDEAKIVRVECGDPAVAND